MKRRELILAAMAPGGGYRYTPVQIQKLVFLIDRQIPDEVGGPLFDFEPYHYGPFDRTVYDELTNLAAAGLVTINYGTVPRNFALTPEGETEGTKILEDASQRARDFIIKVSLFARTQSFSSLVSAIYKAFPEMRKNSVFQQ
jgi:uncharacterized protein YwgA